MYDGTDRDIAFGRTSDGSGKCPQSQGRIYVSLNDSAVSRDMLQSVLQAVYMKHMCRDGSPELDDMAIIRQSLAAARQDMAPFLKVGDPFMSTTGYLRKHRRGKSLAYKIVEVLWTHAFPVLACKTHTRPGQCRRCGKRDGLQTTS